MGHTKLFDLFRRTMKLAADCDREGVSTEEGLRRREEAERSGTSRRQFLGGVGAVAAVGTLASLDTGCSAPDESLGETTENLYNGPPLDVGIVGAGLAGLACADQLRQNGIIATLYEASARTGGRQYSLRNFFPGQTVEMGGELIDTSQKNMINYARAFNLTLEDYNKSPGAVFYHVNSALVPEAQVIDSYRAFVSAIQADLRAVSSAPTADTHNDSDVAIDNMSIAQYLASRGADALLTNVVQSAYVGEYGREITEQSALNFILYIRADRRSKFEPFGTSDQRYHIVEGNDGVAKGLTSRVQNQLVLGMALASAKKLSSGKIELTFKNGVKKQHDIVVFAMPFTVLRTLGLDPSLGLPAWKTKAINELGYGLNSKNMVGFDARPWAAAGNNGMVYATLPNIQNCWETSWTTSTSSRAVITNFTGGNLGASQDPSKLEAQMMAWPKNPLTLGSYTCYRPGQFTSIAGNEGKPIGNLYFAGEHCDSFYDQQGFMEGALISGQNTASAIMTAAQKS